MPNLRPMLLITLVFLGYLLWLEWQKDYGPQPLSAPAPANVSTGAPTGVDADAAEVPATFRQTALPR